MNEFFPPRMPQTMPCGIEHERKEVIFATREEREGNARRSDATNYNRLSRKVKRKRVIKS
jgi:hypothetical protein